MKLLYIWITLGFIGIVSPIIPFIKHKNIYVLLLSLVLCSLTIAGIIKITSNTKFRSKYIKLRIISFLGCLILGGYINMLAFASNIVEMLEITGSAGMISILVSLFDKESRSIFCYNIRDCFKSNILMGFLCIMLIIPLGVLYLFFTYSTSTYKLLTAIVNDYEDFLE